MAPVAKKIAQFAGVSAVALLAACADTIVAPEQQLPAVPGVVLSEPVRVAAAAGAGSGAGAGAEQPVTYVSLPSGTFAQGHTASVTNLASGATRTALMIEGGFDPVPIAATVGDMLRIEILVNGQVIARTESAVPERKPPVVVRTEPFKKQVGVPLNFVPRVVLSEPVDRRTISAETVKLLLGGLRVEGTLTLSADGLFAVFDPAQLLAPGAMYTLVITTGVADLAGDALEQQVEVTFETGQTTVPQGEIVFQLFAYVGNSEIYRMNLDGSRLVQLASGSAPDWSPDGSRIAFVQPGGGLSVMNADGSGLVSLPQAQAVTWDRPAWSPDGSKIAYTVRVSVGDWDVFVINADGTNPMNLTGRGAGLDANATWSPDGSKIAFSSDREGTRGEGIYVMNSDGSNVRKLNDLGVAPAWSPDGSKIVYGHNPGGNPEIYVMNADGTGVVNITNDGARDLMPAWSPDGKHIVFSSWRGARFGGDPPMDIYVMNADGSNVVRITASEGARETDPHWRRKP